MNTTTKEDISRLSVFLDELVLILNPSKDDGRLIGNYTGKNSENRSEFVVSFSGKSVYIDANDIMFVVNGSTTKHKAMHHFIHNEQGVYEPPVFVPDHFIRPAVKTKDLAKHTAAWFHNDRLPGQVSPVASVIAQINEALRKAPSEKFTYVVEEPDYTKKLGTPDNYDVTSFFIKEIESNRLRSVSISHVLNARVGLETKDIVSVTFVNDGRISEAGDSIGEKTLSAKFLRWYRPALSLSLLVEDAERYGMRDEALIKDDVVEWLVNGNLPK